MSVDEDKATTIRNDITRAVREATGLHECYASSLGAAILERLQTRWGGDRIYVPQVDRPARDAAIREAFTGRNHDEVCRQFGISRRTLYRILTQHDVAS
jgi:Mor family transcriptional regulator